MSKRSDKMLRRFLGALVMGALALVSVARAEDITLRFTVWDGDESLKVLRRLCREFEAQHPGVKVKLENFSDYALYHQKMLVQYAANVAPDVAMMDMGHFAALANRGALLKIDELAAETPGFKLDEYYEPILRGHSIGGHLYVLPRDIAPMGLVYYNKRLFDQAGIPYPDGSWTWDFEERPELREKDFLWVCRQLTKKRADGSIERWGFASGWPQLLAETFAYSLGARYGNDEEAPTKVTINDPRMIQAFQFASDFMNELKYMPNSTETSAVQMQTTQQMFVGETIAMYQNGIWEVPNMRKMLKPTDPNFFEWDITLFPAYKDGTRAAPTGGSGYSIFASTKHPKEAWQLVQFMAGPPGMTAMAKAGIAQPAIRWLAVQPGVWVPGPETPKEQMFPPSRIFTDTAVDYVVFGPRADYWPSVNDRMAAGIELLWNGQATAQDRLTESARRGQERLDTMLKEEDLPPFNWTIGLTVALLITATILFWVYRGEFKHKLTRRERVENFSAYWFLTPWIVGMVVFTLGPMILSLLMSFADWDIIVAAKWRGLGNYTEAFFTDPVFWKSLTVTAIYTFVSVPVGLLGSLLLALLMNQKVAGMPLFRAMYYMPSLASLVAASLIWRRIFNPENGFLNALLYGPNNDWPIGKWLTDMLEIPGRVDWLGMQETALPAMAIMSIWGIGGGMVIILAGLQGVPQHYYEAATVDGAGVFAKFRAITWPMLTPTLFFTLVTGLIGSFQVFTQAFVMTQGGPNDTTRFFMLHLYGAAFQSLRMGYASALAWILFFIILLMTLAQFKFSKWVYYEAEAK